MTTKRDFNLLRIQSWGTQLSAFRELLLGMILIFAVVLACVWQEESFYASSISAPITSTVALEGSPN